MIFSINSLFIEGAVTLLFSASPVDMTSCAKLSNPNISAFVDLSEGLESPKPNKLSFPMGSITCLVKDSIPR